MPLSNRVFDKQVEVFLGKNRVKDYFDIGCGAGKYGKMIKKINPQARVIGIEIEEKYIRKYETEKVYDQVINQRIEDFIKQSPSFYTEIAILGDLIEHLFKSDGLDLIHYLMYRAKFIITVFPSKFVMYDFRGVKSEAHNSVWCEQDFKGFDYQYFHQGHMNLVILKGFLGDPETIYNLDKVKA